MRAPPESLMPITGAPTFMAWSMTLQIFSACASEREPNTVKSWLNTNTQATVDGARPGHHPVARDPLLLHAELGAAVVDEGVDLLERAGIEQELQALANAELAALVLRGDTLGPAAHACGLAFRVELLQDLAHRRLAPPFARASIASLRAAGKPGRRDM
jgi:hypothetical protein